MFFIKKIIIVLLSLFLFLPLFSYASVAVPKPSDFNNVLKKGGSKTYYWDYTKYLPQSIVVLRQKKDGSIYYCPTLSPSIISDGKYLTLDGSHSFYFFHSRNGELSTSGGIANLIDLDGYDVLYISNAYTPDGQRLDNLGGGESGPIGNDSWGHGVEPDIDPNIPDFGFDKDNNNPNNSFFSSLVSYFKELISTFKKYFAFAGKVADRILTLFSDTYRLIKRFFDDFLKFSKFLVDFFNENNFFEWLQKLIKRAFLIRPDYFKNKIDGIYKAVDDKITISNYKELFTTMKYMSNQPFDDIKVNVFLFGSTVEFVIFRADFLNSAVSYFKPVFGWFLYFFLGLYHLDQIYFLIRGTKYFNGMHTSSSLSGKDEK